MSGLYQYGYWMKRKHSQKANSIYKAPDFWYHQIMVFLVLLMFFLPLTAQSDATLPLDTCYACHDTYKNARHGNVTCTDCHGNIQSLPHDEKVEKPTCAQCHNKVLQSYTKSVHALKNMKCVDCHDTHSPSVEKKNCQQCHTGFKHRTLPSEKKHLSVLTCEACHASVQKSSIDVRVAVKKGTPFTKGTIDLDNNNILDKKEWNNLLSFLQKDTYKIDTKYSAKSDVHGVKRRAKSCNACHAEGPLFKKALLKFSGVESFEISVEPKVFIPDLPSIEQFKKTLHGRKGITCSDCHTSQVKISDQVCISCHKTTYNVYKHTSHASSGATVCTDCHNPHSITTYKELNARERLNICTRCHQDYLTKHSWLPNTTLHFNYLECSTCHSPKSTKSIAFYFSYREGNTKRTLTHKDIKSVFTDAKDIASLIDTNRDRSVVSQELSDFFIELKRRTNKDIFIGSSLIVTNVYHDYSFVSGKGKVCGTCHSEDAPFYESMYLVIPEEKRQVYIPVKGTKLSALPAHLFVDLSLLGEEKIKRDDIRKLFILSGEERRSFIKELGLKWIDAIAIVFIIVALFCIILHIIGRIIWRR
jgi:predicted CXXCH cytochrome family protein